MISKDKTAMDAKASCLMLCATLDRIIKESEEQTIISNNSFKEKIKENEKRDKDDELKKASSIW